MARTAPSARRGEPPDSPASAAGESPSLSLGSTGNAAPGASVPGSGPVQRERRDPDQRPLIGGARATDPPLTTRDCADWMGMSREFIRGAIDDGELAAED